MLLAACSRVGLVVGALGSLAVAQGSVLKVGDGGYASIQSAVGAAADGDLILVDAGFFVTGPILNPGKGISVFRDGEAADLVLTSSLGLQVTQLDGPEPFVWRGMGFRQDPESTGAVPLLFSQNAGTLWMERSRNTAGRGVMSLADCAQAVLVEVEAKSPFFQDSDGPAPPAVDAIASALFVFGGEYIGARGRDAILGQDGFSDRPSTQGGHGFLLTSSALAPFGARIEGGTGGNATESGIKCLEGSDGGSGIFLDDEESSVFGRANALIGGAGGADASTTCLGGDDGPLVKNEFFAPVVLEEGTPRGLETGDGTFREGEILSIEVTGLAGEPVFLAAAGRPQGLLLWPLGALAVDPAAKLIPLGVLSESGLQEAEFEIPELGPGVAWVPRFLQALHVNAMEGKLEFGPPSAVALIDSGF